MLAIWAPKLPGTLAPMLPPTLEAFLLAGLGQNFQAPQNPHLRPKVGGTPRIWLGTSVSLVAKCKACAKHVAAQKYIPCYAYSDMCPPPSQHCSRRRIQQPKPSWASPYSGPRLHRIHRVPIHLVPNVPPAARENLAWLSRVFSLIPDNPSGLSLALQVENRSSSSSSSRVPSPLEKHAPAQHNLVTVYASGTKQNISAASPHHRAHTP